MRSSSRHRIAPASPDTRTLPLAACETHLHNPSLHFAAQGVRQVLPREKRFFWLACMGATAHWILACIIAVFGLSSYIIVAIMGLLFSGSNLWGYFKCSREAQADLKGYINSTSNTLMQGAIKQQLNSAVSRV